MFDRWVCWWPKTWAFRIFKQHHTQLNSFYWVNRSAHNHAMKDLRAHPDNSPAQEVFKLLPQDMSRINFSLAVWGDNYKEFMNWTRLSAAVAICSYLEVYLKSTVTLALESDPGLLISAPRAVDGVKLLKSKHHYSYAEYATPVVKGAWQERLNAYKNYFGKVPTELEQSLDELDELRRLRNCVGHIFGRNPEIYSETRIQIENKPFQKLSEDRLKKWLGIVENVVTAVDEHLRKEHIGAYEAVAYYHEWIKTNPDNAKEIKTHVHSIIGIAPKTHEYFQEMITYYKSM